MDNNNILWKHSEQDESEYTNEKERTSALLFFLSSHSLGWKRRGAVRGVEPASAENGISVGSILALPVLWKKNHSKEKKKRDHWINSMNFMNVNLIFFLISQWEISPRFSLSILCQLLIMCFFCNSFISPTPGCLCGLLYFPVMLKAMHAHTVNRWTDNVISWAATRYSNREHLRCTFTFNEGFFFRAQTAHATREQQVQGLHEEFDEIMIYHPKIDSVKCQQLLRMKETSQTDAKL